jgi:hypothetical protein
MRTLDINSISTTSHLGTEECAIAGGTAALPAGTGHADDLERRFDLLEDFDDRRLAAIGDAQSGL